MYLWWSSRTLYLNACQVKLTVGDSGLRPAELLAEERHNVPGADPKEMPEEHADVN